MLGVSAGEAPGLSAQSTFDPSSVPLCDCEISATEILRIGQRDGEGIIESESTRLAFNEEDDLVVAWVVGGHRLSLFAASGEFLRAFGREGVGPGDISRITGVSFSGERSLHVLDYGRGSLLELSLEGDELVALRLPVASGRLAPVSPDSVVVVAIQRSSERAGYPLHLVTIADTSVQSFGSDGGYSILSPFSGAILGGHAPSGSTVWWGQVGRFHFEGWDPHEHKLRAKIAGAPPWWNAYDGSGPNLPRVFVISFAVDAEYRLWSVTRIPDPEWHLVQRESQEGLVPRESYDAFWDTRIDVYDLRSGAHLGSTVRDDADARVYLKQGRAHLGLVEDTDPFFPQVVLYELTPGR